MPAIHSANLPDRQYHAEPGITFHRLRDFIEKGPRFYYEKHVAQTMPPQTDAPWMTLGRAYHSYGLEGEEVFAKQFIVHPATYQGKDGKAKDAPLVEKPWSWNATVCQEWRAAQTGKQILSQDEWDAAVAIGRNMRANKHAARLLGCGWCELTISQTDERFSVPVKGRIDWLASTSAKLADAWAIADPKGTNDINAFKREAISYGYHRQMAFYRKLVRDEIGKQLPVFLIALEKTGSHRCRPVQIDTALLDIGEEQNELDLDKLAEAYRVNQWPLDHDESLDVLTTPAWMIAKQDAPAIEPAPWEVLS